MTQSAGNDINQSRRTEGNDESRNMSIGRDMNLHNITNNLFSSMAPITMQKDVDQNIIRAAILCDHELIRFELSNGADANTKDLKGWTVLMWVLRGMDKGEKADVVETLINAGADVNEINSDGQSALMLAAGMGLLKSTKMIIRAGARIDEQNKLGMTPLIYAAMCGNYKTTRMLLYAGADVRKVAPYNDGTAVTAAIQSEDTKVFKIISRQRGVDINAPLQNGATLLMLAAWNDRFEIVRYLVDQVSDINTVDNDCVTALMYASYHGNLDIVRSIAEAGADLDMQDRRDETALMHALQNDHIEIAQYLIDKGASIDIENNQMSSISAGMIAHRRGTIHQIPVLNTENHRNILKKEREIYALIKKSQRTQQSLTKRWVPDLTLISQINRSVHTPHNDGNEDLEIRFDQPLTGCPGGSLDKLFDLPTVDAYFYLHAPHRRLRLDPEKNNLKVTSVSRHGFTFRALNSQGNSLRAFALEYRVTGYPVVDVTIPEKGEKVVKGKYDIAVMNGRPWHEIITWDILSDMKPTTFAESTCLQSTRVYFKIEDVQYSISETLWKHLMDIHPDTPEH